MPLGSPSYSATSVHSPFGIDAEDAAERNVGDVQVAGRVEHRAFEEAVRRLAAAIGVGPVGPNAGAAEAFGHAREDLDVAYLGRLQQNTLTLVRRRAASLDRQAGALLLLERRVRGDLAPVRGALGQVLR